MSILRPSRIVHAALGLSLVMLAGGCPLFEVDADLPEVCVTHKDIAVPGVPLDVAAVIDETFTIDDLSAFDAMKELDADARFLSATVRATAGVGTLAFVESASVEIASNNPDSTLPTRVVYACNGDCTSKDNALVIPAQDQSDALDYIRSGSLSIAVQATGSMPTEDWIMDAEICVAAEGSYAYEP
ncbi:MAG TPA: hypothetical protein VHE35_36420 [Kofleriaceae bacterium]|nr:hypothetical protein [Kofleriaceae bacterium]